MRFRHPDGTTVHLAYCTNVHQAEDLAGVRAQLSRFAAPVRARLGTPRLGIGLWLPAASAGALAGKPSAVAALRAELDRHGLEVVTLNGFPYQGFHAQVVKRAVYRPDWTEPERAAYTLDLALVLTGLLPDDVEEGSISTLPLGWRHPWPSAAHAQACGALARVGEALAALADQTGRRIRLGLEPEPGCVVESTPQAVEALAGLACPWIGVCLDTCHLAVQFEDPTTAVAALARRGVGLAKAQISCALRVTDPAADEVAAFAEPRFLHQTRERTQDGVIGVDDLDDALAGELPGTGEWRVHFHVPVHTGGTNTTQPELVAALAALVGGLVPATPHLEVETYTWTVLPPGQRPADDDGLVEGLARELAWTRDRLTDLGLREIVT